MKKLTYIGLFYLICLPGLLWAKGYPKAILRGDYPDPTIIRDGNDYYMTHSPFVYAPGFLIWHSTDLVNWRPLARTMTAIRGSAYAPDLAKHDGKYYIYYPASGTNWVIWANNIQGPWSEAIDLKVKRIDPGHVVGEDGKRYLHLSAGMMIELADDGLSCVGELFKTYKGWRYPREWVTECFCLESPKLNRRGEYYYLTSAQGGTAGPPTSHMVVSARSQSVKGPWENSPHNPIVHTYSGDELWWSKGHGTLVDDVNGQWWVVYHGYEKGAHTLGRQTLIDPIEWTDDGWFRLDKDRKPLQADPDFPAMELSDDFSAKELGLQWTTWGGYRQGDIELKDGSLYLQGKATSAGYGRKLLITVPDRHYQVQVEVDLEKEGKGGLILYYRETVFGGITADHEHVTIHENASEKQTLPNTFGSRFFLRIINQKDLCTLQISKDGKQWQTVKDFLDVSGMHHNNHRSFYALRAGLVAVGKAKVRFDNFHYCAGVLAPKPLYRDPVYDGAADPIVIWNPLEKKWWMFYTNRRATETHLPGVSWVFKTALGIAESVDGVHWTYVGTANFPHLPPDTGGKDTTLWAPDIVYGDDGTWTMTLSIQEGVATRWGVVPGGIHLFASHNLRDWKHEKRFGFPGYDTEVFKMADGTWRMYYKDPTNGASTFKYVESRDLREWTEQPITVMSYQSEGPTIFNWEGYTWMVLCDGRGMSVFRSKDVNEWEKQPGGPLMPHGTGTGKDDRTTARHGEIVISNGRAYLYYFTHPGRIGDGRGKDGFDQRRSSIQVVELELRNGWLVANRNIPTYVQLTAPK